MSTTTTTTARLIVAIPRLSPSVNHMYRPRAGGGRALSDEAMAFRDEAVAHIRAAAGGARFTVPAGDLAVDLRFTFPTRRRADLDNRAKAAIDALAIALGFDDARVKFITLEHAGCAPGAGCTEIALEAYR